METATCAGKLSSKKDYTHRLRKVNLVNYGDTSDIGRQRIHPTLSQGY